MPKKPQLIPLHERVSPVHCCEQFHITPLQFTILSIIQRVAHREGASFFVSIQDLAEPFGYSTEAIRQALHALTGAGWLKVCGRGRTVHYKAVTHEEWSEANPGCCCQKRDRAALTSSTVPVVQIQDTPTAPPAVPPSVAAPPAAPPSTAVRLEPERARQKADPEPLQATMDAIATASGGSMVIGRQDSGEISTLVRRFGSSVVISAFQEFWRPLDDFEQKHARKRFLDEAPQRCRMVLVRIEERERQERFGAAQRAAIQQQAEAEAAALTQQEAAAKAEADAAFADFEDIPTTVVQ